MSRDNFILGALLLLVGWFAVSHIVFRFRHPWATETEALIYTPRALKFEKVPYNEARPRD